MIQIIKSENSPAPIGPYSQAIKFGDTVYVSGQVGLNPVSGDMEQSDLKTETHQVMKNLEAVLAAAELTTNDVLKCNIFILDMADFAIVNEVYGSYFKKHFPARETIAVAGLPRGARVEISCIAVKSGW